MRHFLLFLLLSTVVYSSAQHSVTFELCDLPEKEQEIRKKPGESLMIGRYRDKLLTFEDHGDSVTHTPGHAFVGAAFQAYLGHTGVVYSPDMVWLTILQGLTRHVKANADSLRYTFVDFPDKEWIIIEVPGFDVYSPDAPWAHLAESFTQEIGRRTKTSLLEKTQVSFSTTSSIEQVAMQVSLLDAMSSYFLLTVGVSCGVTHVTLEGTPEDWELVLSKANGLRSYGLDWWMDELEPVLEQFVRASKGDYDLEFWNRMVQKEEVGCGESAISGWLTKFIPYYGMVWDQSEVPVKRERLDELLPLKKLPLPFDQAEFVLATHKASYKLKFISGFVGASYTKALGYRPSIAWMVVENEEEVTKP